MCTHGDGGGRAEEALHPQTEVVSKHLFSHTKWLGVPLSVEHHTIAYCTVRMFLGLLLFILWRQVHNSS